MKTLIVFPDLPYFNWQVLVQINNFIRFEYADKMVYVVGKNVGKNISPQLKGVLDNMPVEYYVYDDTREGAHYPSSLRPHLMDKFFTEHPEMSGETFLYTDPDVLFSKPLSFGTLAKNDTWYLSDTKSYIDSRYIRSKSDELFDTMCKIVKVDNEVVVSNDDSAGGAQYLMKNLNAEFWKKVYKDSEDLYGFMKRTEGYYNPEHPIQSWTADMWAVLWNAWYFGHETKIASRMSFSWSTDVIANYENHHLFHNAGVMQQKNMFSKVRHQKNPFDKEFSHVSKEYCSYKYVEEIEDTKKNYPELVVLF